MSDKNAEKSKLLNKQKAEKNELEKKLKKAKGAMKDGVQKTLDETLARHEEEMAKFLEDNGERYGYCSHLTILLT